MTRASLVAATLCALAACMPASAQQAAAPVAPPAEPAAAAPASAVTPTPVAEAAKPTPPAPPAITLIAKVDLTAQRLTLIENGKTKASWAISSGAQGFATPVGSFKPEWTAKMWYSRKYDMAPMPHAVFFKGGAAIHGTQALGSLGSPASHGCVRLAPANAATFYGLVQRHGLVHTRIQVFGTPKYRKPSNDAVASRRDREPPRQRYATYAGSQGGSVFFTPSSQGMYRPVRYVPAGYRY